jgi:hypothetical protein
VRRENKVGMDIFDLGGEGVLLGLGRNGASFDIAWVVKRFGGLSHDEVQETRVYILLGAGKCEGFNNTEPWVVDFRLS